MRQNGVALSFKPCACWGPALLIGWVCDANSPSSGNNLGSARNQLGTATEFLCSDLEVTHDPQPSVITQETLPHHHIYHVGPGRGFPIHNTKCLSL